MRRVLAVAIVLTSATSALAQQPLPQCRVGLPVSVLACINYPGHIVARDASKGTWQVQCDSDKEQNWVAASDLKRVCVAEEVAASSAVFVGRWEMFTGGGGAYFKQPSGDWKMGSLDVAKTPPLTINADGTYVWADFSKPAVRGRWRALASSEFKYPSNKPPVILLMNAMDAKDWQVTRISPTGDNRDRIEIERRDLGLSYRGTRMK